MRTKEEVRGYNAAYYAAHREEQLAQKADYYVVHRDELRAYCVAWRKENPDYDAVRYQENRDTILEKKAKECREFTEWLQRLRAVEGCSDCGTHDGLLDHHHIDPTTKKYNISQMASCSPDTLEEELEKCAVLCRSCHKKRHAKERM